VGKIMIFCKIDELTVRSLERHDKHLLVKWLSDNQVLQYYEGRNNPHDEDMVEEHFYSEGINETRCIIEYSHIPIGYVQFYPVSEEECDEYGYANFQCTIFGMDQFIGETKYWGQGIGKVLMKSMINFLITVKGAQKIILDPQSWNERAIKCYEKSGFIKVKLLPNHEFHEGEFKDCWLMEYDSMISKRTKTLI
jgi:aminoglycoside 6'-N-acetyltransferase